MITASLSYHRGLGQLSWSVRPTLFPKPVLQAGVSVMDTALREPRGVSSPLSPSPPPPTRHGPSSSLQPSSSVKATQWMNPESLPRMPRPLPGLSPRPLPAPGGLPVLAGPLRRRTPRRGAVKGEAGPPPTTFLTICPAGHRWAFAHEGQHWALPPQPSGQPSPVFPFLPVFLGWLQGQAELALN